MVFSFECPLWLGTQPKMKESRFISAKTSKPDMKTLTVLLKMATSEDLRAPSDNQKECEWMESLSSSCGNSKPENQGLRDRLGSTCGSFSRDVPIRVTKGHPPTSRSDCPRATISTTTPPSHVTVQAHRPQRPPCAVSTNVPCRYRDSWRLRLPSQGEFLPSPCRYRTASCLPPCLWIHERRSGFFCLFWNWSSWFLMHLR